MGIFETLLARLEEDYLDPPIESLSDKELLKVAAEVGRANKVHDTGKHPYRGYEYPDHWGNDDRTVVLAVLLLDRAGTPADHPTREMTDKWAELRREGWEVPSDEVARGLDRVIETYWEMKEATADG